VTVEVPVSAPNIVPMASDTQRAARSRKFPIAQKPAAFANTHQRSRVVKQVHEEKHKDEVAEPDLRRALQIQLQKGARRMRQREKMGRPMAEPKRNACESNHSDSKKNGAAEFARHQNRNQHKPRSRQQNFGIGNFSKRDIGGWIGDNHLCVPQADKRNEQAYACSRYCNEVSPLPCSATSTYGESASMPWRTISTALRCSFT